MLIPIIFAAVAYPIERLRGNIHTRDFSHEPLIAFIAGVFIYIGIGDLFVEAHKKFNLKVIVSVLLGFVLVFVLKTVMGH